MRKNRKYINVRRYRNRHRLIADILEVVSKDAKKTAIMKQANLSFKVLQRYLDELVDAQLIRFDSEKKLFRLEDKGWEFCKSYRRYSEMLVNAERQLNFVAAKDEQLERLFQRDIS